MGPYLLLRFFMLPAPLLLFSRAFYWTAVANLALADALSNIHSFIIIATNHCGDDMYKFVNSCTPRSGTFYMRAITSSANFRTSNGVRPDGVARKLHGFRADVNDFFHGCEPAPRPPRAPAQRRPAHMPQPAAAARARVEPRLSGARRRCALVQGSTTRSSTTASPSSLCFPTKRRRRSSGQSATSMACRTSSTTFSAG